MSILPCAPLCAEPAALSGSPALSPPPARGDAHRRPPEGGVEGPQGVLRSSWRPSWPIDVPAILAPLRRGPADPTVRLPVDGTAWLTASAPTGPATLHLRQRPSAGVVECAAWGPGAAELLATVPALLGAGDDPDGFVPRHALVRVAAARHPGWRVPRTGRVLDALVPAVLEQKVTGAEAHRSWRELVHRFGRPAPGPAPAGMAVPPCAERWRTVPSWEWHRAGVDGRRASAILRCCRVASQLERLASHSLRQGLLSLDGVGPWTVAEVGQRACGDADAVSVGDLHLAKDVGWALLGRPVDDEEMLAELAAYPGHRYRVIRLLQLEGLRRPRFAPRYAPRDIRRL